MSLTTKKASTTIPAALALALSVAVMPSSQSAIMPMPELRPAQGPIEIRTPGRRR